MESRHTEHNSIEQMQLSPASRPGIGREGNWDLGGYTLGIDRVRVQTLAMPPSYEM